LINISNVYLNRIEICLYGKFDFTLYYQGRERRKWNWIGHTLRKETGVIEKTALDWNPRGYRRTGRPKRTWQRTIEDEIRRARRSWNELKGIAGDRNAWKLFMDALCSIGSKRI